jgi:hypothetical protein
MTKKMSPNPLQQGKWYSASQRIIPGQENVTAQPSGQRSTVSHRESFTMKTTQWTKGTVPLRELFIKKIVTTITLVDKTALSDAQNHSFIPLRKFSQSTLLDKKPENHS